MYDDDLIDYYARRANEYDSIYSKPERQEDLARLIKYIRDLLRDQHILELACGTGYWTEAVSPVAHSITATDINGEVLSIAKKRKYIKANVRFAIADANDLSELAGEFTAVFAAFYWSHLHKQALPSFISKLQNKFHPGTLIVFADNVFVEGSSTPISATDKEGNTYQDRELAGGERFRVLKNFPDVKEIRRSIGGSGDDLEIKLFKYYWCANYRISRRYS